MILLFFLPLTGCGKKEDPYKEYSAARSCFEAATGYKSLAEDQTLARKYDELLQSASTVIEKYEADAPDWAAKPGDAVRQSTTLVQLEIVAASTTGAQAELLSKYSLAAANCANRF